MDALQVWKSGIARRAENECNGDHGITFELSVVLHLPHRGRARQIATPATPQYPTYHVARKSNDVSARIAQVRIRIPAKPVRSIETRNTPQLDRYPTVRIPLVAILVDDRCVAPISNT
jgi:hypothetical protein